MVMKTGVFAFFFCFFFQHAISQDASWWNQIHHWDGITPWNQYMTISPAFLGPNALPVPDIKNGSVDSAMSVSISFDHYQSTGDRTQDFFIKGILPLFKNRMSVEMDVVPLEWYRMDTLTRDIRAVRTQSGKGSAGGDIYVATTLQIVRDKKMFPDMQLRFALKTASGTHLRDARFTDAPGYFFDMSFGKNLLDAKGFIQVIRLYADIGFYTYQTYDIKNLQNDCVLYGAGITINSKRFSFVNHIGGYSGYIGNGDKPLVFRSEFRVLQKLIDYSVSWQQGLNDYDYSRFRVSVIAHLRSWQ
jgi:hypothetical protein